MKADDLARRIKGKKLIGYGATQAYLSLREVTDLPFAYLVDDTPGLAGKNLGGVPIFSRERLGQEDPGSIFIVVCAFRPRSTVAMSERLRQMGFVSGEHFQDCSPLFFNTIGTRIGARLGVKADWDLFTRVRSLCLNSASANLSTPAGTWLFIQLLDSLAASTVGDVAEYGVYQGQNAFTSCLLSRTLGQRDYHLMDSFAGFGEYAEWEPEERRDEFKDVDFAKIGELFDGFARVHLHRGYFRDTLPLLTEKSYAMVYLDADVYEPTVQCCEYFWPRLSSGGYLLCHDYWLSSIPPPVGGKRDFVGANKAINEFFADKLDQLIVFPETTHVLVRKP